MKIAVTLQQMVNAVDKILIQVTIAVEILIMLIAVILEQMTIVVVNLLQ